MSKGNQPDLSRRQFLQRAGVAGAGITLPGLIAACGGQPSTSAGGGGGSAAKTKALNVRTWGTYAGTLDPAELPTYLEFQTMSPVYEGLMAWKPGTFEPVNCLAESCEPNADGTVWTFELKKGIPFQGGYGEVTAQDVKFSFERAAAAKGNKDGARALVSGVKVTGPLSGTITLKQPYAPFAGTSLEKWSWAIVSEKAVNERGEKFKTSPICTGPYEVAEFNPQTGATLKKFAEYGGATKDYATIAPFDEIVYRCIVEDNTAVIAIESGELTYSWCGNDSVERLKANQRLRVDRALLPGQEMLGMNVENAILKDRNMREAIRYAIDRQAIIDGAYSGLNPRMNSIIGEGSLGYWADAPVYEQDLAKAKAAFQAAGSPSEALELTVITNQAQKVAAQIISEQLKAVGIKTKVKAVEVPEALKVLGQSKPSADTALIYWVFAHGLDPAEWTQPFISDSIGSNNIGFWSNSEFDGLYDKGLVESDNDTRAGQYIEMQKIYDTDAPGYMVVSPTHHYAGAKGLKPVFNPMGFALYHFFSGSA